MAEREKTYGLICRTIEKLLNGHQPKSEYQVLVTGAGLGRLAFDIAKLGYSCQGNEFSFHMLLASNMILNRVDDQTCYTIYPWAHAFSNQISADKQALGVTVPDCQINGVIPEGTDFSMIAGEFLEAYADQSSEWDCVVSCFFIDTAHNILDYLEGIYRLLRPGGYWINLGPLLYHFESIPGEASIELTLEEILMAAELVGFQKSTDIPSTFIDSTYAGNDSSMLTYHYNCAFFVMRKPQ